MPRYQVNVRAIVRASHPDKDASYDVQDWDVYDHDAVEAGSGSACLIRCDQVVTVEGSDVADAVAQAKVEASPIVLGDGWECDDVDLWVDTDQPEDVLEMASPTP